jgi:hypothetical protein
MSYVARGHQDHLVLEGKPHSSVLIYVRGWDRRPKRINQGKELAKRKKMGKRKTGEGHRIRKREERSKGTKTKSEGIKVISEKKERAKQKRGWRKKENRIRNWQENIYE